MCIRVHVYCRRVYSGTRIMQVCVLGYTCNAGMCIRGTRVMQACVFGYTCNECMRVYSGTRVMQTWAQKVPKFNIVKIITK